MAWVVRLCISWWWDWLDFALLGWVRIDYCCPAGWVAGVDSDCTGRIGEPGHFGIFRVYDNGLEWLARVLVW